MDKICAFAPATVANLSVGFDLLGLALDSVGDKVEVWYNGLEYNRIIEIVGADNLPMDVDKNSCSVVVAKIQSALEVSDRGVDMRIYKGFQSGSGMGSSSASSAAAAFAFNELAGAPFKRDELIPFAAEGERAACGAAHVDNVAPALMGGIVLVREHTPIDVLTLPMPKDLYAVILFPQVKINTKDSRGILSQNLQLSTVSKQCANVGAFVASLYRNDLELFSRSMQDFIAEPSRKVIIPLFDEMKQSAISNGALGFGISGSGPSVFSIVEGREKAETVREGLESLFKPTDIKTYSLVESLDNNIGARISDSF